MKNRPVTIFIVGTCLLGLVLIGLIIWLEKNHPHSVVLREVPRLERAEPNSPVVLREVELQEPPGLFRSGIKFLDHLAIAFLSIGIIGLLLELPRTRRHFHEEMVSLILDKRFLKNLSEKELRDLQVKTLNAVFQIEDIGKAGGFFDFYTSKIQHYLASPYREQTAGVFKINYLDDSKSFFLVEETVSYVCKKLGHGIQEEVRWVTEKDELERLEAFEIRVCIPQQIAGSPTFSQDHKGLKPQATFKAGETPENILKPYAEGHGHVLSLKEYKAIDGLEIESHATYVVSVGRAFSWWMPYLSKGLKGTITFPADLKIYIDLFGLDSKELESSEGKPGEKPGEHTFEYRQWLMPGDGFAFHFMQRKDDGARKKADDAAPGITKPASGVADTPAVSNGNDGTVPAAGS